MDEKKGGVMKVAKLMTANVVSVDADEKLQRVKDIFSHIRFHHLLVVEKGRLFGVISDRDLFKALSPYVDSVAATTHDLALLNKRAHQIMSRDVISLPETAAVVDALEIFNTHNISCIPIIDEDRKPLGILTWRDIIKALHKSMSH